MREVLEATQPATDKKSYQMSYQWMERLQTNSILNWIQNDFTRGHKNNNQAVNGCSTDISKRDGNSTVNKEHT